MDRLRELWDDRDVLRMQVYERTICRVLGHKLTIRKMYGRVCKRCRIFERY